MFPSPTLETMPVERLEAELCHHAAQSAAAMYRWLLLVAEFDRRDAAGSWGCRSTAAWLAWKCGVDSRTARDHVRVANSLATLPSTSAAFGAGELPYSKVRALTRVATAATEAELLDFARVATTEQLERTVRACRRAMRPVADGENEVASASAVHHEWTDEGTGRLFAELEPHDAAIVFAALDAGAERIGDEQREGGSAEPLSVRRARSLVELAERSLDGAAADAGDDRFLIVVHADVDAGTATLEAGGAPLDTATLARLLCDQPVAPLIRDGDGNPLFLGRTSRVVSRAMRRALRSRDGDGCAFPGCPSRSHLHGHHVRWWTRDLGPTDITNLLLLCTFHHTLVHKGVFTVAAVGDGRFEFRRASDGALLARSPHVVGAGPAPELATVDAVAGGEGGRLDLDAAVTGLASLLATSA